MEKHNRFLFLTEGQLGDLQLLTPAIGALKNNSAHLILPLLLFHRRTYNNSNRYKEIVKSTFSGTAEVFKNNSDVDEVLEIDRKYLKSLKGISKLRAELKCIRFLKKMKFDTVIWSFPENRFVIYSYLTGAGTRIGQKNQSLRFLLTHHADIDIKQNGVCKYYCGLLETIGVKTYSYDMKLILSERDEIAGENKLRNAGVDLSGKIICIHPGASAPNKIWPVEYFAYVINYIAANSIAQVIICYNNYDAEIVEAFKKHVKHRIFEAETETISELAAIMQQCILCIVNNSGHRHLAAALGKKNIAIFTNYDNSE